MLPIFSPQVDKLITDNNGQLSTYPFPENLAGTIRPEVRKRILQWMLTNYIWPQVQERLPFEVQWNKLLNMSRAALKIVSSRKGGNTRIERRLEDNLNALGDEDNTDGAKSVQNLEISDTLIFDAIDRLTNLNHFISFKERFPVRYEQPEDMVFPMENSVYSPMDSMIKAANCWLGYNVDNQDIYRKYWMTARHHYTYGISLVNSEFVQRIGKSKRRDPANKRNFIDVPELQEVGVTFEPLSIRKVWLNWRLPVYKMEYQACPFFFEEVPRFAIVTKPYDAEMMPFGFQNIDSIPKAQYLFGSNELQAWMQALDAKHPCSTYTSLLKPEHNVELLWTLYPMLPLGLNEDKDGQFIDIDEDGSKAYEGKRYIMQMFGSNLTSGLVEIVRLQENFYPGGELPLFGSAHIPTLDDGAYPDAIGTILENHYFQSCKCLLQYFENKDFNNDPSAFVQQSSPAMDIDLNEKGGRIPVNSDRDVTMRQPFDSTGTTLSTMEYVRDQAKTSSKTVDAILGKAMGSRTSATEASNIFQTAMSGVTTDVNMFSRDIGGGYASKLWDYSGRWVDPDVFAAITGGYGFAIQPEHFALKIGISWDSGSKFMESITRQNNIKFLLQAIPPGDPSCNRSELIRELLKEWRFRNIDRIVTDQGFYDQVQMANMQAQQTFLGQFVIIDPDQDHAVAIKVKKSYLADRDSVWNRTPEFLVNGPNLVKQIQQHIQFQMVQFQMQQLQMMQQAGMVDSAGNSLQQLQNTATAATTGGQVASQTGSMQ